MTDTSEHEPEKPTAQIWISGEHIVLRDNQIDALWERIDSTASLSEKYRTIKEIAREVEQ